MLIVLILVLLGVDIFYPMVALKPLACVLMGAYLFTDKFEVSGKTACIWLGLIAALASLIFSFNDYGTAFWMVGLHFLSVGLDR